MSHILSTLYDIDSPARDFATIPAWVDPDIHVTQIAAIIQGGCASGAYMPAVTYADARRTMAKHGDEVLTYIEDHSGQVPPPKRGESWSGIAVFYLSIAVELWSAAVSEDLAAAIEDTEDL